MTEEYLVNLIDGLTINENIELSVRDQEPDTEFNKIINNTNTVKNFFSTFHNINTIQQFIDKNVLVFRMYLTLNIFNCVYDNVTVDFLTNIINFKKGLHFFISNYNKNNIQYNIEFIKNINQRLHDFALYHYYETGFL